MYVLPQGGLMARRGLAAEGFSLADPAAKSQDYGVVDPGKDKENGKPG